MKLFERISYGNVPTNEMMAIGQQQHRTYGVELNCTAGGQYWTWPMLYWTAPYITYYHLLSDQRNNWIYFRWFLL